MTPGLTFEPVGHIYRLDGRQEISVTGVLKSYGLIKLGDVPRDILERARRRGQDVHTLVHYFNDGDLNEATVAPEYEGYLLAWRRFRLERRFEPILNEYPIASRRYRVCGTLDCLGLMDGQGALCDVKTGSPDDVAADLQTAAYEGLAREWAAHDPTLRAVMDLSPYKRIQRCAVQLRPDGTFTVEPYNDPRDWLKFVALVQAYHIAEERGAELTLEQLLAF